MSDPTAAWPPDLDWTDSAEVERYFTVRLRTTAEALRELAEIPYGQRVSIARRDNARAILAQLDREGLT